VSPSPGWSLAQRRGPGRSRRSRMARQDLNSGARIRESLTGGAANAGSVRLLDMGCANGALLGHLRRRGFENALGVDPSPRSADVAAAAHGVRVEVGTFASLPAGLGTFDCICLTGVLEHVWDIDTAMAAIRELLRPDGIVYVDVPDAPRYLDPYIAPFEDFSTEHVNHSSGATLATLANRFGMASMWAEHSETDLVPGQPCAVVTTAWRHGPDSSNAVRRDEQLSASLHAFAARSTTEMAELDRNLREQLADHDSFAVWGVGEFTMKLLALPALASRRLAVLIDGNPARHGLRFGDVRVGPPTQLANANTPIVIGSLLSGQSIRRAIEASGWPNPVIGPATVRRLA